MALILELASDFWGIARTEFANTVCELLEWKRPNGKLKTVECFQFLDALEEKGILKLAPKRQATRGRDKPVARTKLSVAEEPILGTPAAIGGVVFERVVTSQQRQTFKELIDRYHYLGYKTPFGAHSRYMIRSGSEGRLLGCLQFSRPAWKVQVRDECIGCNANQRESCLQKIVQNSRFLILPWVEVKNLASHILGRVSRLLPADWKMLYGYRPLLLETFVEERFSGTSYRAANWVELGETKGRGRMDRYNRAAEPTKVVWVYPLHRQAKSLLLGH